MKLSNKGFSLTEIMISLGLFGVIGITGMKIMSNNSQSVKTIQTSTEFNSIYSQINKNFLNKTACQNTIGTNDIRTVSIDDIKNPLGDIVYDKVNSFGNNTLKLKEIELKGSLNLGLNTFKTIEDSFDKNPIPAGEFAYGEINLEITFEKIARDVLGGKTLKRLFVLRVEVDENYKTTNCFSSLNDAVETTREQVCNDLGGVYNDITGCSLTGSPSIGSKVKQSACEMFGGTYSSVTGICNTALLSASCLPSQYLESFDLIAGTKVCKALPIGPPIVVPGPGPGPTCSAIASTSTPDGIDNDCDGQIDEKSCPSGYTALDSTTCQRLYTRASVLGCLSGHRLGNQLGSDYGWDPQSCYKTAGMYICADPAQYRHDADSFGYCELKRRVQVSRPCPTTYPNGTYSVNFCYISYASLRGVATCSGAPAEQIDTEGSGMGSCMNVTPIAPSNTCTSGYTYNTVSSQCERTSTRPMIYN